MKKIRFAGLLLLAPLTLLAACAGATPTLSFNANWYRNTSLKANISDTYERLEYAVSFEPQSDTGFSVAYTDGTYTTELKNDLLELDNSRQSGYVFTTSLEISVQFSLDGEKSEVFRDVVRTEAQFLSAADGLKPVRSFRTVRCHAPASEAPISLKDSYFDYYYSYSVEYDDALSTAETVYLDLSDENSQPRQKSYELAGKGSFLDNEQILFALRGVDLSAAYSFRSLNLVTAKVQEIALSNVTETAVKADFEMDGEPVQSESLAAISVDIGYSGSNRGQSQTVVYAKTTDPAANVYRNVPLSVDVPILHTLGTLRYRLSKAAFASK